MRHPEHMKNHKIKLVALAASCVAIGIGIGAITTAGANTSAAPKTRAGQHRAFWAHHWMMRHEAMRGHWMMRGAALGMQAVEGQAVIHTASGWSTVSFERGTVQSVSGSQLTLEEGTPTANYKSVTVTIPSGAVVRIDHQPATLSQLKAGQRVAVLTLPNRTVVIA